MVDKHSCFNSHDDEHFWCSTEVDKSGKHIPGHWGYCTETETCLCGSNKVIKGFSYNRKYAEVLKRKSKITSNFYSNKSKFFLKFYSLEI